MSIQNGKKPLSAKAQARPSGFNMDDIFGNRLGVNPELATELDKKGLSYRWVNAVKLSAYGGYHERGWRPIKRAECATMNDTHSFMIGNDPEGYIRRGDCVLAVRPKEINQKHKQYLAEQARVHKATSRQQAEQLKQFAKETNLDMSVVEGADAE